MLISHLQGSVAFTWEQFPSECSINESENDTFKITAASTRVSELTHLPLSPHICQWIGWALVQIMACRLFGTKLLSKPMLGYYQLDPYEQIKWILNQNTKVFIHKNASEYIVCEMTTILSRGQWVNREACHAYTVVSHHNMVQYNMIMLITCQLPRQSVTLWHTAWQWKNRVSNRCWIHNQHSILMG